MEPVEIELRMKQNLEAESKKAKQGIEGLASAAEKSQAEVKQNIAIQKKAIADLQRELKPLEAAFKKVNIGTQDPKVIAERKKLSGVIKQMTADLKAEEKALTMLEQRTETTGKKMTSLRTQMMNARDTMGMMRLEGRANTDEYRKLEEQLGTLGTAYREMRTLEQATSTGGTQLAGLMEGLNVLSGTISAGAGALALFNGDSEKMAEIQTKLQGVMAISIGLMQVSNALHSTSAFRITTVTKVKELWAAANLKVATTLGISNVAAKALMATLTLGLSVAITAAMFLIDKFVTKQRKAAEEAKAFSTAVADGSAEQLAAYAKLRQGWIALNGDLAKQKQYITDNVDAFDDLGVAVNDVNTAEKVLIEQTDAFKKGIIERAKAVAVMEMAAEKYKKIVEKEIRRDEMSDTTSQFSGGGGQFASTGSYVEVDNKAKKNLSKEIEKDQAEADALIQRWISHNDESTKAFEKAGVENTQTILEGSKLWWETQKKNAQEKLAAMRDMEKGSAKWNAELAKYREAEEKLNAWSFNKEKKEGKTLSDKKERDALAEKYKELEQDAQKARIAAMRDGIEKTLAENEMSHQTRLNQIERQKNELLNAMIELEKATWESKGGKGVFKTKIDELPAELNEMFIAQTEASLKQLEISNEESIEKLIKSSDVNKNDTSAVLKAIANTQREKLNTVSQYESLQLKELAKQEQKLDVQTYNKKQELIKKQSATAREAIIREADEALKSIPKDMLDDLFSDFDLSFANLDHATLGQLNKVADKLEKLSLNKGELLTLGISEAQITELQQLLADLKSEGAGNVQTAKLGKIQEVFGDIGSLMSKAGDDITRAVGDMVSSLSQMMATLNDPNASGFQKVSGIVSLAITAGNQLAKIRDEQNGKELAAQKSLNEELASQLSIEMEINKIRRERAEIERNSSAFLSPNFTDEYKAALKTMDESEKTMNDAVGSLMNNAVFSQKGSAHRRLFGTKTDTYEFSINDVIGGNPEKYMGEGWSDLLIGKNPIKQLQNGDFMDILGSFLDPAGIFGGYADGKAEQDAYKRLGAAFDSTLKAMGKTSADMAKMSAQEWVDFYSLMEAGGNITDKGTKEMVATAKAAAEEYATAMEKMRDIIAEVAGSLGSQLTNDLVNAFKNGEDAAMAFKKSVNDVLQTMFMQSIQTAFFKKHFDKLQADMDASMKGNGSDWEADLMNFFDNIEPAIGKAEQAMKAWDERMSAEGYDGLKGDGRTGKNQGIAQASQDSIDELNGRVMAISGNVYKINEGGMQLISIEKEALLISRTITAQLDVIANNTAYCRYLVDIDNTLEDIKVKGVKIR